MGRCETFLNIVMKINVIFTGGTIGSSHFDGYITPDPAAKYRLIKNYQKTFGTSVEFTVCNPYTILSENLSGKTLSLLMKSIKEGLEDNCDGIIVAHGTDTLQYSAIAAAYCFGSNTKPIMFVSANYPLENPNSNGNLNFEAATEFIKQKVGKGVYVSYSNDLKSADFHFALNLLRHGEFDHKVYSLGGGYAIYKNGEIFKNTDFKPKEIKPMGCIEFKEYPEILNITVNPFENYSYDLKGTKAVVFNPYHSGTLNVMSSAFKEFCTRANNLGIPLYVTGVTEGGEYQSMKEYTDLSIIPVYGVTSIALLIKLWIDFSKK